MEKRISNLQRFLFRSLDLFGYLIVFLLIIWKILIEQFVPASPRIPSEYALVVTVILLAVSTITSAFKAGLGELERKLNELSSIKNQLGVLDAKLSQGGKAIVYDAREIYHAHMLNKINSSKASLIFVAYPPLRYSDSKRKKIIDAMMNLAKDGKPAKWILWQKDHLIWLLENKDEGWEKIEMLEIKYLSILPPEASIIPFFLLDKRTAIIGRSWAVGGILEISGEEVGHFLDDYFNFMWGKAEIIIKPQGHKVDWEIVERMID